jgi:Spy/CpxP family protein refolding chaperone
MDKTEKGFQEEGPFSMMPPMPCPMEQMRGMPGSRHPFLMHIDALNLDEKQKDALKEIENSVSKELIRKRADEQIAGIELCELLDQETVDLKAVEAKLKQIAVIKTEMQLIVIKSMENVKAKLTAEQRETLKKMRPMAHPMNHHMKGKIMPEDAKALPLSPEEKGE